MLLSNLPWTKRISNFEWLDGKSYKDLGGNRGTYDNFGLLIHFIPKHTPIETGKIHVFNQI